MKSIKNIKSIFIVAIIGIISLFCFNKSLAANTAKVTTDIANIRKNADTTSTIVEQATKGQEVEIIEKSGEWYKVKYNKVEGYLRQDLIELNTQNQDNAMETSNTSTTTSSNANVTNTSEETNKQENDVQENEADESITQNENTEQETKQEGMYVVKESTKLKIIPLINSNDIKEIGKDTTINVLEINNKWALAESGNNRGWVLFSKLEKVEDNASEENAEKNEEEQQQQDEKQEEIKEKTMYINSEVVNLRKEESTSSESIAKLTKATEVVVVSEANGWSKVKVNGKEGYVSTSLLSETKPEVATSRSLEEARKELEEKEAKEKAKTNSQATPASNSSSKGGDIVATARQYLGSRYVYGGTTPAGFDCSGFTQYVYKQHGVSLSRTAEAQAGNGKAVSKSELQPGDLVIFTSHVGIYAGNGTFIHAANPSKGVITTSLSDSYYTKNYITARRIFN